MSKPKNSGSNQKRHDQEQFKIDVLASSIANHQNDMESNLPQSIESERMIVASNGSDDAEWLNIAFEEVRKANPNQQGAILYGGVDMNDSFEFLSDDKQDPISVPTDATSQTEPSEEDVSEQQVPPDEKPVPLQEPEENPTDTASDSATVNTPDLAVSDEVGDTSVPTDASAQTEPSEDVSEQQVLPDEKPVPLHEPEENPTDIASESATVNTPEAQASTKQETSDISESNHIHASDGLSVQSAETADISDELATSDEINDTFVPTDASAQTEPSEDVSEQQVPPDEKPVPLDEPEENPTDTASDSATVSTPEAQTSTEQETSDISESNHIHASDAFSVQSAETADISDEYQKYNEVSDTMEGLNTLNKSNKGKIQVENRLKNNETNDFMKGLRARQDVISDTNEPTIVVSLASVFLYILKNITIVVLAAIMCGMAGYVFANKFVKPKYVSNTKIIIFTAERDSENDPSWEDMQLSFNLLTDCSQIIKSRDVLEEVADELNLSTSYDDLFQNVDVSFMSNSRIIEISVTDEDPLMAMQILKKLREVSMRYICDNLEVSDSKIIQKENVPHYPISTDSQYYVMMGAGIGIIVSSVILIVVYIAELKKEYKETVKKNKAKNGRRKEVTI